MIATVVFPLLLVALAALSTHVFAAADDASSIPPPPVAKKVAKTTEINGRTLVDNYAWMRDKQNPEVAAYLQAENAYTDAVMKPTEPFQKKLYDEMLSRIKETDVEVPYKEGNYFYYTRTEAGKQYQIYCRKKGSLDAPEEVLVDVNELAKGQKFMSLRSFRSQRRRKFTGLQNRQYRFSPVRPGRQGSAHRQNVAGPRRARRLHHLGQRQQNHFLHRRRRHHQAR